MLQVPQKETNNSTANQDICRVVDAELERTEGLLYQKGVPAKNRNTQGQPSNA
jgi:hypothetical protein